MIPVRTEAVLELLREEGLGLIERADAARRKACGDEVHLRGIVEFSNACSRNCLYCGLRRDNHWLRRYRMEPEEIVAAARRAERAGARTVVLQSGEDDRLDGEWLAGVVAAVKQECDVAVTLSVGVRSRSFYLACRQAGADRFLLKHETASERLYRRMHPDSLLEDRLRAVGQLRELGYQTGGGCIVGLPGQDLASLAGDLVTLERLDLDMVSIGALVPHPDTPLAAEPAGSLELTLRVIAAARLILGAVHMPAATALDAAAPGGRERVLGCGANVIMPNFTPEPYRRLYELYPGRSRSDSAEDILKMLGRLGRPVSRDLGDTMKAMATRRCE